MTNQPAALPIGSPEVETMTKFTAFYPQMVVHIADCADAKKEAQRTSRDTMVTREALDLMAFLGKELEADLRSMGYSEDDFDVKPCARRGVRA